MTDYTPLQLAERRRSLALEYKEKMTELGEVKKRKAFKILELMAIYKTITKAEAVFATTPDGQKEIELTFLTKGLLETMRAVKTEVDMKSAEAFGNY